MRLRWAASTCDSTAGIDVSLGSAAVCESEKGFGGCEGATADGPVIVDVEEAEEEDVELASCWRRRMSSSR